MRQYLQWRQEFRIYKNRAQLYLPCQPSIDWQGARIQESKLQSRKSWKEFVIPIQMLVGFSLPQPYLVLRACGRASAFGLLPLS